MLRSLATRLLRAPKPGAVECLQCSAAIWLRDAESLTAAKAHKGMHAHAQPAENDEDEVREVGNERVRALAEEILTLNLLDIADLTTILKKRLGVSDTPMFGAMPMQQTAQAAPAPAAEAATPAEEKKEEEKKEFDLKLESFDAASKIKIIKEVRAITDLGLKQAKELVEKAPQVVKGSLDKKTAEELKKKLESVGAKVSLE
eukprot:evm.model.scf_322.3 EVM.evm.TU.scf_322.3   scf_322:71891-73069(-)